MGVIKPLQGQRLVPGAGRKVLDTRPNGLWASTGQLFWKNLFSHHFIAHVGENWNLIFFLRKTVVKRWRRPAFHGHYLSFVCNKWHFISNLTNRMITNNVYNGFHVKQLVSLHSSALSLPWSIWCNAYYVGLKIVPWRVLRKRFCKDSYWSPQLHPPIRICCALIFGEREGS